jgi:alkylation response protein AidB-like acyl-CoA dehydrogenase
MDFALTEQQELIRKEVSSLARSFPPEYWLEKDGKAEYPWEFVKAFRAGRLAGRDHSRGVRRLGPGRDRSGADAARHRGVGRRDQGCSPIHFYCFPPMPVIKHGTELLKRKYLPRIATGEIVMAFGVTEPNAGTDYLAHPDPRRARGGPLRRQRPQGVEHQRAVTPPTSCCWPARRRGRRPSRSRGSRCSSPSSIAAKITVRVIEKLGRAAVDSNEIYIDGLEVPAENVVGEVGNGFYHLLDSLNPERIFTGIEAVGIGRAALARAVDYAKERVVFDRPIGKNQAVAHPLAMAWAKLETAELMCLKAAWLFRPRPALRRRNPTWPS